MAQDPEITELRRMIEEAQRIVFFTGAGISTESGIPDFRSPGGIWTRMRPIDFSDFLRSDEFAAGDLAASVCDRRDDASGRTEPWASRGGNADQSRQGLGRDHAKHRRAAPGVRCASE